MKNSKELYIRLIDNYAETLQNMEVRYREFNQVFESFQSQVHWDILHFTKLLEPEELERTRSADGLILSGSEYNLSEASVREEFAPLAEMIRQYEKPILGICFGHQLLAHTFGFQVRPMRSPYFHSEWWDTIHKAVPLTLRPGFPLIETTSIWVEFSHHEEVVYTETFLTVFDLFASTKACRVQVIAHKQKPFFGLQFHPETNKDPQARQDGQKIFEGFFKFVDFFRK